VRLAAEGRCSTPLIRLGDRARFWFFQQHVLEGNASSYSRRSVTNTGASPLSNVIVVDDNGTPGIAVDDFNPTFVGGDTSPANGLLDPGEVWTYTVLRQLGVPEHLRGDGEQERLRGVGLRRGERAERYTTRPRRSASTNPLPSRARMWCRTGRWSARWQAGWTWWRPVLPAWRSVWSTRATWSLAPLVISGKTVSVTLTNNGAGSVDIDSLFALWPAANGKLAKLKAGGVVLFDAGATGTSTTITSFKGTLANRTIAAGASVVLTFEFANNAGTNPADYDFLIDVGDGISVTI
jgi:hypothetical protein